MLAGTLKPPPSGSEARSRYYQITADWCSALSLEDCVALAQAANLRTSPDGVANKLFRRWGELDYEGAARHLGVDTTSSGTSNIGDENCSLYSEVLRGFGQSRPQDAWGRYLEFFRDKGSSWYGQNADVAFHVFASWGEKNPGEALKALGAGPREDFQRTSTGYYRGLSMNVDFRGEAKRLEEILGLQGQSVDWLWSTPDWPPEEGLPLLLVRKWADRQPDEALEWWIQLKKQPDTVDDDYDAESAAQIRAHRIGQFVEAWAGDWEPHSPDTALRWVNGHLELLEDQGFVSKALPTIARHRPGEGIDLILRLNSPDEQARWLAALAGPPAFEGEGYYRRQVPSAILDPDLVERSLPRFNFGPEQTGRVMEKIRARLEHEAAKPSPLPSEW